MASGTLLPAPWFTALDANGNVLSGAKAYFYLSGTTTLTTTYSDVSLTIANTNPVLADSAGRVGPVFLSPGTSVKLVLQDSTGAAVRTQDNISAIPPSSINLDVTGIAGEALTAGQAAYLSDGSGSKTAGSWYKADSANPYSSTLPQVGMVPASIAAAASGTIRLAGQVTGLSALTVGTTYYVGTAGALTATAPANARRVGVADTTASVVMAPNPGSGLIPDGVVATPGLAFLTDPDTGLYHDGANGLALATNGIKAFTIDSTEFIDSPTQARASAYHNTTQSLTNATYTALSLNTEDFDVGALHDTVTNNSRMTIPTGADGLYLIVGQIGFANNTTGGRVAQIFKNGTTALANTQAAPGTGAIDCIVGVQALAVLAATDYIELRGYQSSGGALLAGSAATRDLANILQVVKLW